MVENTVFIFVIVDFVLRKSNATVFFVVDKFCTHIDKFGANIAYS
jgi:hypothetical protein